jgi:hypothetical protein
MSSAEQNFKNASETERSGNSVAEKPDSQDLKKRLIDYAKTSFDQKHHFIEFRLLQWLNLVEIQYDLAKRTAYVRKGGRLSDTEKESLRMSLREYGTSPRPCDPLMPC